MMAAIAAAASPLAAACGGQVEGGEGGTSGTSGGQDPDRSGSSSSSGASSGSTGSSGNSVCGGTRSARVPYEPPMCESITSDAGEAPTTVCETERELCERLCADAPWNTPLYRVKLTACSIVESGRGGKEITCLGNTPPCGRAHEGLAAPAISGDASAIARWLENAAYLEDASVTSFELLAMELAAHEAPPDLVASAERSARDEVRHARTMNALARRHGGCTQRAAKQRRSARSLDAMLHENAIEGCVRETYGAALAWYQAAHAKDAKVKAAMDRIAVDETRHAALAWSIAEWGEARVGPSARAAIEAARVEAWRTLGAELAADPEPALASSLGLPSSEAARTMLGLVSALAQRPACSRAFA